MYFKSILKNISLELGHTWYHGPKSFQNLQDQLKTPAPLSPVCYLHFPIRGTNKRKKQGFGETEYSIEILLGKQSQLHWEMDLHDAVIEEMEAVGHIFLNKIINSPEIHEVSAYNIYEVINIFDMNLSGVIIECTITPFDRRPNCG